MGLTRRRAALAGCALFARPAAAQEPGSGDAPVAHLVVENGCPTAQRVAFASYAAPDTLLVQGWTALPFARSLPVPLHTGRPVFHYAYLDRSLRQVLGDLGAGGAAVTVLPTNPDGDFAYRVPTRVVREIPGVSRRYGAGGAVIVASALRPPVLYRVTDTVAARPRRGEAVGDREARVWRASRPFLTETFSEVLGKPLVLRCP
jgi:hypothetical protein